MKRPYGPSRLILVCLVASFTAMACGGSSSPSPPNNPPPPATASLTGVAVNPPSVTGGTPSQGTVTLSAAAPAAGSTVTLTSGNTAAASVPASITIPSGATSGTFAVSTQAVTASTPVTITASMGGATQTATLTVTPPAPPALVANFVVTSASRGSNACVLASGGNEIDCEFDARTSTGTITEYRWEYLVGAARDDQNTPNPVLRPRAGCGFLGGQQPTTSGGVTFIQMEVRLRVVGPGGELSAERRNTDVRLFPNGNCYGF